MSKSNYRIVNNNNNEPIAIQSPTGKRNKNHKSRF